MADYDSDTDSLVSATRATRPAAAAAARRAPYTRAPSTSGVSSSSRAESSRRPNNNGNTRRGISRLDTEDDMSSIGGYRRPGGIGAGMDIDLYGDDDDDGGPGDGDDPEVGEPLEGDMDDVRRLGVVWVRERGTPDIMKWEGELVDTVFDKLEQQQKMVDTLRTDTQTTEEEHFKLMLVMTEMERVKYLARSYVRTRLWKVEKFSQYITSTPALHPLLSGVELSHARRYTELLHGHYQHSVLDSLPDWLQKTDETDNDGLSMVLKPNKNVPVLIYCRRNCGEITISEGESAFLSKGTTHLVKYSLVEQWIKLGWAEVLG